MKLCLILDENKISEELKSLVSDFDQEIPMVELKWVLPYPPRVGEVIDNENEDFLIDKICNHMRKTHNGYEYNFLSGQMTVTSVKYCGLDLVAITAEPVEEE